jgi:hypothetical protein
MSLLTNCSFSAQEILQKEQAAAPGTELSRIVYEECIFCLLKTTKKRFKTSEKFGIDVRP